MSDESRNPALALHDILNRLWNTGGVKVQDGWHAVLSAQVGTLDFAQRHGEVVGLLNLVGERLRGLPDNNRTRIRCEEYVPQWHSAIVFRGLWNSAANSTAQSVISVPALHQLESLGEQFDSLFGYEDTELSEVAVTDLRSSLQEWRNLLDSADLPRGMTNQIRGEIDHIEWLLANVDLFGSAPVVNRSRQLVGSGVMAMATRPGLATRINAALVGVVGFLTLTNSGVEQANGILEGVQEMATHVQSIADGERSEPAEPRQLGPADIPTQSDGEIIDVEAEDEAAS